MVQGIEKFKEQFKGQEGKYVFIGGTACTLMLEEQGILFRATKDFDIVLLIEDLDADYVKCFCEFIKEGQYQHINKSRGTEQFYRFEKPISKDYPYMIELFSRKPQYINNMEVHLAPLHIESDEEMQSLSAIILNEEYYQLLTQGNVQIQGVTVLDTQYLILFKIRAWLDLSERKENGESIDSKNIKKHKNDIFKLLATLDPDMKLKITGKVIEDVQNFLDKMRDETINLDGIGTKEEMLTLIKNIYLEDEDSKEIPVISWDEK